jgi:tRNA (guanine37-N1)-methyltransferase
MKIDILTIFPEMFEGVINNSMLKRAQEGEFVEIKIHNLRDWTSDKHNTVDDRPYGGGPGMIMKVDVIDKAVNELKSGKKNTNVILLDAGGNKYTQQTAKRLSKSKNLILIAGHYEGVDHRVHEHIADEVISIGDYVLTGGEIPAMVIVDSVVRLIPGVLGTEESLSEESHSEPGFLEYPQYTRPEVYKKWKVPKILLTGNHAEIAKWKKQKAKTVSKK